MVGNPSRPGFDSRHRNNFFCNSIVSVPKIGEEDFAMQLQPADAFKVSAILSESVQKLEVLSLLAPENSAVSKEELSDLVNDEISRIIEEQRRLQARYEELIMQRNQMKNMTNKPKYKEIHTEIEEIATALRYATKVLCRNLKESPDIAENQTKVWFYVLAILRLVDSK